ncbi:heme ABC exporter ATP-binding protein CcmA [Mesorhizobium sp. NBSH29]|uniref:heme ABC exporter ATP-binding protein CcmA n=1 Tax=Mesorhizobium sp. NBSH29 TaxID=2654249 RepID=UPI001896A057|nr:heme ABC exporter ATP-binding protein CcmA [Mesorhizobium sp. NBSH29]QPC86013.1 heme ABC exporter ATP-binding protein CcmA [Mesorhizobium sp. NBSH29]
MRLIAENLGGTRGGETVFAGVSFDIASGSSLVVTGPNGSGKSTLLRVIAGLLPVAQGALRLADSTEFETVASACHYLGHQNAMKAVLSLTENLVFWQTFMGAPDLHVDEALAKVGLGGLGHLPFGTLSTGQRRRAAIARLLISARPLWLLDEPTAGLDRKSETRFSQIMDDHLRSGGMIVAATHQPLGLDEAKALALALEPLS